MQFIRYTGDAEGISGVKGHDACQKCLMGYILISVKKKKGSCEI